MYEPASPSARKVRASSPPRDTHAPNIPDSSCSYSVHAGPPSAASGNPSLLGAVPLMHVERKPFCNAWDAGLNAVGAGRSNRSKQLPHLY